ARGSRDDHVLAWLNAEGGVGQERGPVGTLELETIDPQGGRADTLHRYAVGPARFAGDGGGGALETEESVGGCLPGCQLAVARNEPRQGALDLPEGGADLHQGAQRNDPREVARRGHQKGEDHGELCI